MTAYLGHSLAVADRASGPTPPTSPSGVFTFIDPAEVAVLSATTARFAIDDNATTMSEAAAGSLREITIYDVALDAAQIGTLP